jgi:hypothetical protein
MFQGTSDGGSLRGSADLWKSAPKFCMLAFIENVTRTPGGYDEDALEAPDG